MAKRLSYTEWKQKIDDILINRVGLSTDDLPDYNFTDAYEDGESPVTVLMMLADERDGIAATVRVVADVQAEADPLVGVRKEPLDLRLVLHVGLGVRVEDDLEPVLRRDLADLVGGLHELGPRPVVEIRRRELLSREQVRVDIVDQDQVPAAELRDEIARLRKLVNK